MTTPVRKGLRMTHRALWYAVAVVLVLMALGAVVASRLLSMAERNPERVEAWLGERAGHRVEFDRLETDWTRRGPLLRLDGLRVGEGGEAVTIGAAEVLVAQYAGLLPGRSLTELRLRDLALTLARDGEGRWHVRGLPGQDSGSDPFSALERLGELQVIGGSLTIEAPDLDIRATVPRIDLRLRVDGSRVRAAARAWMRPDDVPVRAAARFDRGSGDGRLYAGMSDADLDGWSPLLRYAGIAIDDGHGRAEAWVELRDSRVENVAARLALEDVGIRGAQAADGSVPPRIAFDRLRTEGEWRISGDGWRIDLAHLHVGSGDETWLTEDLSVAFGSRYALVARRVEAAPLLSVLSLSNGIAPGLREWLHDAAPNAAIEDVELAGMRGGPMRGRAKIASLAFAAVGDRPGVSGVSGELSGDAQGALFAFDPQALLRFDWPSGFGVVHEVALRGEFAAWATDDGWQVHTPALRVDGEGYGADVRGGLRFQGDGSRPWIDLAARLDEARVPVAKGFWVRNRMPEAAVAWLDAALLDGRVRNGRAVVSGDLDDWPFDAAPGRAARGLFQAEAEVVGARVQFQPDWPAAEGLDGHVRFIADGFDFRGQAVLAGIRAEALQARIPDFSQAELSVSAKTGTDAGRVLALLRQSPLSLDYLQGLQARGPVEGGFDLHLPMHRAGAGTGPRIEGAMRLVGVEASEPGWALAFADMHGELRYDEHGFSAQSLRARHGERSGSLSLRAGEGHVREAVHAFEGELRAGLRATELLARVPELDWLRPHARGRSSWNVGVVVPRAGENAGAGVLQLQSDLVGTTLDLPAPLEKAATTALPTRVRIPLPLGSGDVSVQLGQRMSLRARAGADAAPAVRVTLGAAAAAPPERGLAIDGRTPTLAAMDWAALAARGAGHADDDGGLALQDVDLHVGRLLLAGGGFQDVHVRAEPGDGGTRLHFDGEALAGRLTLPAAQGAAIGGHFERLHWRAVERPGRGAAADANADSGAPGEHAGTDPAAIPPIRLSVEDLRLEQAQLGTATLVTRRLPDGMRIEQFETKSPTHHVAASGDWTGRGAGERTRLDMRVASGNFGELLAGLGHDERMRGGDGRLQFDATWPGGPVRFRADALEGAMRLSIRNGQLVEVEPGAGRLLGLLSIAELPRRLSLDFRDFFERGFAFNLIEGDIRVASGQARSDNLAMDGPAARIHIAGVADLRAQTYDQTIEVLPKSGNVLTAVGAITGGPVGAAVGAVANAVLRKPLSELGATTYRVTGPWKEPKVEVVRRETSRVAEREQPVRQEGGVQ